MLLHKKDKKEIIGEFARNEQDTGSSEVQIALLTERINQLNEHLKNHHHDFSSQRGLLQCVATRRKGLDYLKRKNNALYRTVIHRLGLKR